jgi:hypothetical protein
LHYCVGLRRSPIRLRHRTHFPCIVLRLHNHTDLPAFASEYSFPITVFDVDALIWLRPPILKDFQFHRYFQR